MSDFARWERESREDVHAPAPPQETVELDMAQAFAAGALEEPPEYEAPAGDAYDEGLDNAYALDEPDDEDELAPTLGAAERMAAARESLSATAGRVGRWLHSLDRRPELPVHGPERDPMAGLVPGELAPDGSPPATAEPEPDSPAPASVGPDAAARGDDAARGDAAAGTADAAPDHHPRFPAAALGYNRAAVDEHLAALEQELESLRVSRADPGEPPVSITEEIERIGEQTASILVVAHDKAHETARLAHEQAERAVRDASAEAERITAAAQQRLRELDEETEAVWRERERLLEDVRTISGTLTTLADESMARFPAAPEPGAVAS